MEKKMERQVAMNERLVILLMIAHIMVFVSFAIMNILLREVIQFQENVIEFMRNMNEIIELFGRMMS